MPNPDKPVRVWTYVSYFTWVKLRRECTRRGISMNQLIREIIKEWARNHR